VLATRENIRKREREREEVKKKSLSRGEREREREQKRTRNATKTEKSGQREEREKRERSKFLSFPNRRRTRRARVYYPNTHLEVKRTVHAILLRPEDGRQVFRHLRFVSLSYSFFV